MLYNFIDFFHRPLCVEVIVIALWSLLSELFSAQSESADQTLLFKHSLWSCDYKTFDFSFICWGYVHTYYTLISQTHNDYEKYILVSWLFKKSERFNFNCCSTPWTKISRIYNYIRAVCVQKSAARFWINLDFFNGGLVHLQFRRKILNN